MIKDGKASENIYAESFGEYNFLTIRLKEQTDYKLSNVTLWENKPSKSIIIISLI